MHRRIGQTATLDDPDSHHVGHGPVRLQAGVMVAGHRILEPQRSEIHHHRAMPGLIPATVECLSWVAVCLGIPCALWFSPYSWSEP